MVQQLLSLWEFKKLGRQSKKIEREKTLKGSERKEWKRKKELKEGKEEARKCVERREKISAA